jgi:hypothetical protein
MNGTPSAKTANAEKEDIVFSIDLTERKKQTNQIGSMDQ